MTLSKQITAWLFVLFIFYVFASFAIFPSVAKNQINEQVTKLLGHPFSISAIQFDPLSLDVRIQKALLRDKSGNHLASFEYLYADISLRRALRGDFVINNLTIYRPSVTFNRAKEKNNFTPIFNNLNLEDSNSSSEAKSFPFLIKKISVVGGSLSLKDSSFKTELKQINATSSQVSHFLNETIKLKLSLLSENNESLKANAEITIKPSLSVELNAELNIVQLAQFMPYIRPYTPLIISNGAVSTNLHINYENENISIENSNFKAENVNIDSPKNRAIFKLSNLQATGINSSFSDKKLSIASVAGDKIDILVKRLKSGNIDIADYLNNSFEHRGINSSSKNSEWSVYIKRASAKKSSFTLTDYMPKKTAKLALKNIELSASKINIEDPFNTKFSALLNGNKVSSTATLSLLPLSIKSHTRYTLQLRPFQPYIDEFLYLKIKKGVAKGVLNISYERDNLILKGSGALRGVKGVHSIYKEPIFNLGSLKIGKFAIEPKSKLFSAKKIELNGFNLYAHQMQNGSISLTEILKPMPKNSTKTDLTIDIGKIKLLNNSINFKDSYISPSIDSVLSEIEGEISHISSTSSTPSKIKIDAKANKSADFSIVGSMLPFDSNATFKINLSNMELTPYSPYNEKYAGHELSKGKLNLELDYALENSQLTAKNNINFDRFTLGAKSKSKKAIDAPIGLAVTLLKDINEQIDLDVDVDGDLNDPEFSLIGVISRVIMNILTKAIVSPFSMLGTLFGGGEDISLIEFKEGDTLLDESGNMVIKTLQKALIERPNITLEVEGAYAENEKEALAVNYLNTILKTEKFSSLSSKEQSAIEVHELKLETKERIEFLDEVYEKMNLKSAKSIKDRERELLSMLTPSIDEMRYFALQRADIVLNKLIENENINKKRVFLVQKSRELNDKAQVRFIIK